MDVKADSAQLPLKSVIFATDFSSCSENAGRYASMLARQFDAELLVSHAFVLSQSAMEAESEAGPAGKSLQRKDLEVALAGAAQRFGDGVKRSATALLEGDPRERIPQFAEQNAPSIIVLGTSGRGRIVRGLVGSVAERILRSTSGPSLTVGPLVPALTPGASTFRNILYATGLYPGAAQGASYAVGVAKAFQASMEVLHVVKAEDVKRPEQFSEIQKRFRAILDVIVPEQAKDLCNPVGLVEVGNAHERILEYVREFSADLLVLSIRKSSHLWLQARLSGAFNIIANAPCPVLTITG
ncbi:MAG TPA: universal stress protein [Terracidiphilus sp.]|nr:universal stress protein [Terracidiphilus sp.]